MIRRSLCRIDPNVPARRTDETTGRDATVRWRYRRDLRRARKWYAKAADQGDAEAQVELGLMLAQGQGGKVDLADAVAWFRKAAEAGYSPGQYNLGYAYCTGQGVAQDTVQGQGWYHKAAEQGDEWAQANLD